MLENLERFSSNLREKLKLPLDSATATLKRGHERFIYFTKESIEIGVHSVTMVLTGGIGGYLGGELAFLIYYPPLAIIKSVVTQQALEIPSVSAVLYGGLITGVPAAVYMGIYEIYKGIRQVRDRDPWAKYDRIFTFNKAV